MREPLADLGHGMAALMRAEWDAVAATGGRSSVTRQGWDWVRIDDVLTATWREGRTDEPSSDAIAFAWGFATGMGAPSDQLPLTAKGPPAVLSWSL